ncbi:MAG TPA: sigma-70 family RNA polymerase sigma factor [Armatimonadota bacterium]|jgi:RNA polymerase sigma-70 factor (ECF subfamily)
MGLVTTQVLRGREDVLETEDLVRRSRAGDATAFGVLAERHREFTFRLAYRVLGDYEAATDATQETFLRAWRSIRRFRGTCGFATWLHAITVNCCVEVGRKVTQERSRCGPEPAQEPAAPEGMDWALRLALREALSELPEPQRLVVTLYYFADYTLREIAEELGVPLPTVYSRQRAALERLGRRLEVER